jgi:hypothetical protein
MKQEDDWELLGAVREMLPGTGLQAVDGAPPNESIVDATSADGRRFGFSIASGPLVFASMLVPAPPTPAAELARAAARAMTQFPFARLSLRNVPGGTTLAMFDASLAVDPDLQRLEPHDLKRLVQGIEEAAERVGAIPRRTEWRTAAMSPADRELLQEAEELLSRHGAAGVSQSVSGESTALVVQEDEEGDDPLLVLVADRTLVVQAMVPVEVDEEERVLLAMEMHRRLPFGRALPYAPLQNCMLLEYSHLVGQHLSDFDVLHAVGASRAQRSSLQQLLKELS